MKTHREPPPSRAEAWKGAAWYALVFAVIVVLLIKLFTPVVFGVAFTVAVFAFLTGLGLMMRITPKSGR